MLPDGTDGQGGAERRCELPHQGGDSSWYWITTETRRQDGRRMRPASTTESNKLDGGGLQ